MPVIKALLTYLDNKIRNVDDVTNIFRMPLVGVTPAMSSKDVCEHSFVSIHKPHSPLAKSFQVMHENLLRANRDNMPQTLAVTSSMASEAKSSTCINLATVFAQKGKRVLLVDADLRRPTAHNRFELDNLLGLSNYLAEQAEAEEIIQESFIPNVSVVTAGPVAFRPGDLLSRGRLQQLFTLAPEKFDIIILDAPPTMDMSDALALCKYSETCLMIAAYGQSRRQDVYEGLQRLRHVKANIAGMVLTKYKPPRQRVAKPVADGFAQLPTSGGALV